MFKNVLTSKKQQAKPDSFSDYKKGTKMRFIFYRLQNSNVEI